MNTHNDTGNDWMRGIDTLILVTTYRCNLRCRYCPTHKADEDMGKDIAEAAIDAFIRNSDILPALRVVRFFGAEPLLHLPAMEQVLNAVPPESSLRPMVTTNGTMLNDDTWRFLDNHPELEITVSLDGPQDVQRANRPGREDENSAAWFMINRAKLFSRATPITVNMTIAPSQAQHLVRNFHWLYQQGVRKFNFLPAYYTLWTEEQLSDLEQQFAKLAEIIAAMWNRSLRAVVKNMFINAETAFFNHALVVDTDGELYTSSAVLTTRMRPLRARLRIGNIQEDATRLSPPVEDVSRILTEAYPQPLIAATDKVDGALTRFVERLRPAWLLHTMESHDAG